MKNPDFSGKETHQSFIIFSAVLKMYLELLHILSLQSVLLGFYQMNAKLCIKWKKMHFKNHCGVHLYSTLYSDILI